MDMGTLDATVLEPTEDLDQLEDQHIGEEDEHVEEPEPIGEKPDGRKFNREWADELKNLKALYPDKAKVFDEWRDRMGRYGAVSEIAPNGVDDIRSWKTTIDAIGGPEKAAELMQQAAEYQQIDSRIEAGDFSVVGELPEAMQKGFYEMLPEALNTLSQTNFEAFQSAVGPHFSAALAGTGLGDVFTSQVDGLKALHAATTDPEARASIAALYRETVKAQEWYNRQTSGSGALPKGGKNVDPQVARLQSELAQRDNVEKESFNRSVGDTAIAYKDDQFAKLSAPYIKQLGLTESQQGDLKESYTAKIVAALSGDTAFQAQLKAYGALKNRDMGQINAFVQANVDKYAKQVLDGLVTSRYGGVRPKKVTPISGGAAATAGVTRVAQAPPQDQWDMAKMEGIGYEGTVKKGLYYLTGGRSVQLVKS